jgi:hypothetical protein
MPLFHVASASLVGSNELTLTDRLEMLAPDPRGSGLMEWDGVRKAAGYGVRLSHAPAAFVQAARLGHRTLREGAY